MTAYTVGLGCDRGVALQTVREAVQAALAQAGAQPRQVVAAASIVLKKDEVALLALAEELGQVEVPHPSETVRRYTGTPSVSEAAALLAAGPGTGYAAPMTALVVEKHKHRGADDRNVTVSIARKEP